MNTMLCICLLVATVTAAARAQAATDPKQATVVNYNFENIGVDGYNFAYETSDGKFVEERAQLKNAGTENEAIEVRGQFTFTAPDGRRYTVSYVANENGFQPQADHLPKP